jgi:mono/diheme cytochrome c family protein
VKLGEEDRLRLVTWIDANAPYHGGFLDKRAANPPYEPAADHESLGAIAAIHARRCSGCHEPAVVTRGDWVDLEAPERSRFLAAPLARDSGGEERCGGVVYSSTGDEDYRAVRAVVEAMARKAWEFPRRDLAALRGAAAK